MIRSIPYTLAPEAYATQLATANVTPSEFVKAYRDAKKRGTGPLSEYTPNMILDVIEEWPNQ